MRIIYKWTDEDVKQIAESMEYELTDQELEEICDNIEKAFEYNNDMLHDTIFFVIADQIENVKGAS